MLRTSWQREPAHRIGLRGTVIKHTVLLLAALACIPLCVSGQLMDRDVVDRLVAIVGDSVIVRSQVQEEIQRMALGGDPVPDASDPEYEVLFSRVVERFVQRLLILQAAAKDTLIELDETSIDERVSDRITQLTQQFGGQPALQQALSAESLTLAEYRDILEGEARSEQIQQMFFQLRLRDADPVEVTEDELVERFQEARGQLQQRPKTLTFRQVVVASKASADAVETARMEAQALLDRITAGGDFAELAREHSHDPGSAELGGDLGFFRRGRMMREFEDAAFSLRDGEVSDLVQTDFGFHIIKTVRSRPGEVQASHILIIPEKSEDDHNRARDLAADLLARAQAGESMADLYDQYSDPAVPDSLTVAFEQISELPPVYAALRTAATGDFVGPLEYQTGPEEVGFAVVHLVEAREAGAFTLEDLRGQLATQIQEEKKTQDLLEELRANTHIEIRM